MQNEDQQSALPPPHKKRRTITGRSTNAFLRSWAWKREHRPDSVRFEQPYEHTLRVPGEAADRTLSIQQAPFNAEGFASTVWDSSIVVAKFLEKQAALAAAAGSSTNSNRPGDGVERPAPSGGAQSLANGCLTAAREAGRSAAAPAAEVAAADKGADVSAAERCPAAVHRSAPADAHQQEGPASGVTAAEPPAEAADAQQAAASADAEGQQPAAGMCLWGKRCLDLSAGCGLVGIVMALLGGHVTATDLAPNLPLLRANCASSGVSQGECAVKVLEHEWGTDTAALGRPFDLVVACDVMYIDDAVRPLVKTLAAVSDRNTQIFVAHGRNRQAEASFLAAAVKHLIVSEVPSEDLDEVYQCTDVAVWRLTKTA